MLVVSSLLQSRGDKSDDTNVDYVVTVTVNGDKSDDVNAECVIDVFDYGNFLNI